MFEDNDQIGTDDPAGAPGAEPDESTAGPGSPLSTATPAPEPGTPGAPPVEGAQPPGPGSAQRPTPGRPAPATPGAPAPGAAPEPWSIRADNQEYYVEGSRIMPNGDVLLPKAQLQLIQGLLAEGAHHRGSWRQQREAYEARIAELEGAVEQHPDLLKARAFNAKLQELMEGGPEAMAEWLDKFETNRPLLEKEVENRLLQGRLESATKKQSEYEEQQEQARMAPVIESSLQGAVQELAEQYPGVDASRLYNRLLDRFMDRIFVEVPVEQRRRGLGRGETLIGQSPDGKLLYIMDRGLIEDEFETWAGLVGGGATGATNAIRQNAAALAAGAPPVAVGAGGAVTGQPGVPLPKTAEELDNWMRSGKWKRSFPQAAGT